MTPHQALWQHYHYVGAQAAEKKTALKNGHSNPHRDLYYRLQKINRVTQGTPAMKDVVMNSGKSKWRKVERQTEDLGLSEL